MGIELEKMKFYVTKDTLYYNEEKFEKMIKI